MARIPARRRCAGRQNQTARLTLWLLLERPHRGGLIIPYVEHGIEFGDLEQIMHLLGEVEQLQLSALIANGGESADQFTDPGAVNISNVAQVQQDLLFSPAYQISDGIPEHYAAFSQGDASHHVHHRDAIHLPTACLHGHCNSSSFAALRPRCLINVISVPGCVFLNFTSSMNALMRKMPLPDPFIRFSGASGSGKFTASSPFPWSVMVITSASLVFS